MEPRITGKRIVLTTFGSFGDLHPYIALGVELKRRGHRPVIATHEPYRNKVESEGIDFAPVRPNLADMEQIPGMMAKAMDLRTGPEFVVRQIAIPNLRASYDDILAASVGADLFVSHTLTFATRLVAEKCGTPWASVVLSPLVFFSAQDPSVLSPMPSLIRLRAFGPGFYRALLKAGERSVRSWTAPVHALREEIGLPESTDDPLFAGQYSPYANLALFSRAFAEPQSDWPPNTTVCGFAHYDRLDASSALAPEIEEFLAAGDAPIVFTLGSAAVMAAGTFFQESAAAAAILGHRAILLIGRDPRNDLPSLPDGVAAFQYAPFSEIFPRAAANVHQGGVGTTGQAMRAGRPVLVVPYSHDQPDNAYRVQRLGVSRTIPRDRYSAKTAAKELELLLANPAYAAQAASIGDRVRKENGAAAACDVLETLL